MAIDPRQFVAETFGTPGSAKRQNAVKRSQDLLRNSRSILEAPQIIKRQVNTTINRTVKRIPGRLKTAANNIAINAVTSTALGALDRFQAGEGLGSILTGSVSEGLGTGVDGVFGAADQILGQTGADLGLGLGGILNNVGGGVLSGVGNEVISNLKGLNVSSVVNALGDAGTTISGLFGGDENAPENALVDVSRITTDDVFGLLDVDRDAMRNCPPEVQDMWNAIAESLAFDIADPSTPNPVADLYEFRANINEGSKDCAPLSAPATVQKNPKHYASNLSTGGYQPKYKFLFMVELVFHPEYQKLMTTPATDKAHFEFVVKNSTRPNVSFEHEEVNMYNFWTKIPKRTMYEPMTMRFYDDDANSANTFYTNYMRAVSPIANKSGNESMIFPQDYQEFSLDSDVISQPGFINRQVSGASLGSLINDATTVLTEIRLYHLYDWGKLMNVYHMYNPKITNLTLDDVNMAESGDGNELEIQFAYDGLFVEPNRETTVELMNKISGGSVGPGFEIEPIFDGDTNDAAGEGAIVPGTSTSKLTQQVSSTISPSFQSGPSSALNTATKNSPNSAVA